MEIKRDMAVPEQEAGRVLVIGLGKTGLACARYLYGLGKNVAILDSREAPPGLEDMSREMPDVAVFLGDFDVSLLKQADMLVVSPGVPVSHPAIAEAAASGVEVIGDVELFARQARAPVIAITGSNGKSTVTSLVGAMAAEAGMDARVGGNIGTPVLELLQDSEPDCYVLELSSFQLETTSSLSAQVAVVLNVSEDHMDRYTGLDDYVAAKARVYRGDGVMVVNRDDAVVMSMADQGRTVVSFGLNEPRGAAEYGVREIEGRLWLVKGEELLMSAAELQIPGRHNVANVLAALAIGEVMCMPLDAMLAAARQFPGLPHRTQWVAEKDGVSWFNDSKGTNVGATVAAINGMDCPVVLIAGGEGKDADFAELKLAMQDKGRAAVLIGRDAALIEKALDGVVPVAHAGGMMDAVRQSDEFAQTGDCVLLSPACASFDMFESYADRGEQYMAAVRGLMS